MDGHKKARMLLALTVAWNVIEALVAVASGIAAGSLALTGFGLDSVIETIAAIVTLRRFSAHTAGMSEEEAGERDEKVLKVVGYTLMALAAYILLSGAWRLWTRTGSEESTVGIILAGLSLVVMPVLGSIKLKTARSIGSRALAAEAKETFACAYLSLTLFLGMGAIAVFGWWWVDPLAAILMAPWLIWEGKEAIEGGDDD